MKIKLCFLIIFLCMTSYAVSGDTSGLVMPSASQLAQWEKMTEACSISDFCDAFDRTDQWEKVGFLNGEVLYNMPEGRVALVVGTKPVQMYLSKDSKADRESYGVILSPDVLEQVKEARRK